MDDLGICHSGRYDTVLECGQMSTPQERPYQGDEVTLLRFFLDDHRRVLRQKCEDLSAEQLAQPLPPSDMTLGGMLKHLAVVESSWFSEDLLGGSLIAPFDTVDWTADRDWEWHTAHEDSPQQLLDLYDAAIAESRRITDEALATEAGLDTLSVATSRSGQAFSLRWILMHLIEEYAQHNGHADLIRESIDGRTRF
jgi:uncharacterized damage-inducible protein DinB